MSQVAHFSTFNAAEERAGTSGHVEPQHYNFRRSDESTKWREISEATLSGEPRKDPDSKLALVSLRQGFKGRRQLA